MSSPIAVGSRQRSHNPAKANKTPAAVPSNKEQGFVEKRIFYTGEGIGKYLANTSGLSCGSGRF
jgi:hypothetical protein